MPVIRKRNSGVGHGKRGRATEYGIVTPAYPDVVSASDRGASIRSQTDRGVINAIGWGMATQNTPKGGIARLSLGDVFEQADSIRHEAIRKDIATRLRKACDHLSDDDFAALVHRIVKVQLMSERHSR